VAASFRQEFEENNKYDSCRSEKLEKAQGGLRRPLVPAPANLLLAVCRSGIGSYLPQMEAFCKSRLFWATTFLRKKYCRPLVA
jgi:hypothetical protein